MKLSKGASLAISRLTEAGFDAYAVGGCVRDSLMSKVPSDFDVTTSALPKETKRLFTDFTTFETGAVHGTVSVVINGETVEITTFRSDGEYLDHRHPVGVSFTDRLEEDLSRRDFTVNAMAYNEKRGIVDLFGGKEDIKSRTVRCVGSAEKRFEEDALRILRALRFASVLDFDIEDNTCAAIRKKAHLLTHVSRERIYVEIKKLLSGKGASRMIKGYPEVFEVLFGDISPSGDAVLRCKSDLARLGVFFFNKPDGYATLKPSRQDGILIRSALELAKGPVPKTERELKHLIADRSAEAVRLSFEIREAIEDTDGLVELFDRVVSSCDCLRREDLAIGGRELIALGAKPGEKLGQLIDALFEAVLNSEVRNTKEELVSKAKELICQYFLKNS